MNTVLRANLFLLFLVAVFDPADHVTHLKVPLFVSLWVIFFLGLILSKNINSPLAASLLTYIFVFAFFLPLTSILWYFVRGGHVGMFDGFQYLKSFLFLTLAAILVVKQIDAIGPLSIVLTLLSAATIAIAALAYSDPGLTPLLWPIGDATGIFAIGTRTYASLSYTYVYFHTAPLLVISLAYFTYQSMTSQPKTRYFNIALLSVNLVAMLCSGTRNDMIFGLLTPLAVFLWYSRGNHRRTLLVALLMGAAVVCTYGGDVLHAMFDPENESNAIKLTHLKDYYMLFSDPKTLFFGQGLGAYFYSSAFGTETSITELTYLEFMRNFGLIIAIVYYCLLLYPITKMRDPAFTNIHYLIVAYTSYLIICVSNPLLVSSSGMLVLAIVICKVFPAADGSPSAVKSAYRIPNIVSTE